MTVLPVNSGMSTWPPAVGDRAQTLRGRSEARLDSRYETGRMNITLRPVREEDLDTVRRLATDPQFVGNNWNGFRDAGALTRRHAQDGFLARDNGFLMIDTGETAGIVTYREGQYGSAGPYVEIGIVLAPEFRGRGIGWRAQAMLTDYLFQHRPVQRIQAGTQPENIAEQRALAKAGFQLEGVLRACEFRAGQWHDGLLYSRLRTDPAPAL